MGYGKAVYSAAQQQMEQRRREAEQACDKRRAAFFVRQPKAEELERALTRTAVGVAKVVLGGGNVRENLIRLKEANQSIQSQLDLLLKREDLCAKDLEPQYQCMDCRDTGYVDGKLCACMKRLLREEACNQLNEVSPLSLCSFDSIDLSYYSAKPPEGQQLSPLQMMKRNLEFCRRYAEVFSLASPNLLLTGGTGLGKTHLSLSIAREVIERGFGVIYGSANSLFSRIEQEHFGNAPEETLQSLLDCDLLILDDLGTEFRTAFTVAALYNLVNSRQLSQRPTVINTNLTMRELESNYSERFSSRIIGSYSFLPFTGQDIRQLRRIGKKE